jgi:tight adherence protein B
MSAMVAALVAAVASANVIMAVAHVDRARRHRQVRDRLGARERGVRLLSPPGWLVDALADAAVPVPADVCFTVWVGLMTFGLVVGSLVVGIGPAVLFAVLGVLAPTLGLRAAAGRSGAKVDLALPLVLESVARSLRSGAALLPALREAAVDVPSPLGGDLDTVVTEVDRGMPLVASLDEWGDRRPRASVRLAVAALAMAADAGGASAAAVDGVAATLRANVSAAGEVRALASQARYSASVIALAPLAFAVLAAGTDSHSVEFMLRTPLGVACLTAGLGLDAAGAWWMHRITSVTV